MRAHRIRNSVCNGQVDGSEVVVERWPGGRAYVLRITSNCPKLPPKGLTGAEVVDIGSTATSPLQLLGKRCRAEQVPTSGSRGPWKTFGESLSDHLAVSSRSKWAAALVDPVGALGGPRMCSAVEHLGSCSKRLRKRSGIEVHDEDPPDGVEPGGESFALRFTRRGRGEPHSHCLCVLPSAMNPREACVLRPPSNAS